jgi:D-alanyl-D-alanine carboxypeptidase
MNGRDWMIGLLAVMLAGLSGCEATEAAERVALVIGNSEYTHAPSLSNPKRDAEAIARALSGLGFEVTGPLLNQSKAQMDAALKAFRRRAQGATAAVVYFSGHGMELGGQNYLIPQDAVLERDSDVSLEAVGLNVVLDQMGGVSGYRLVILDACRDNPLANNMERAKGTKAAYRGLAPIDPSGQTYVAYAARAGQRSQDGATGGHSPYAEALLKYLPQPGLPLERLFGSVREEVLKATTQTQEPALYGTFGREAIYLVGGEPALVTPPPVAVPAPAPVSSPAAPTPAVDHDYEAWKSAEKCGKAACFRAYVEDYPNGRYARMARAQLEGFTLLPVEKPQPVSPSMTVPPPPQVPVRGHILLDYKSGVMLAEMKADERIEPTSITKLMTGYVIYKALKSGKIRLNDQVIISEKAGRTQGSKMFVKIGSQVSVEDLLMGMVVQSGNDATVALAEHVAGSEETFAKLMNQEAERLGMKNSHFTNAPGMPDPNHYMSARDIAVLARAIIQDFPEHYPRYSVRSFKYNNVEQPNRNRLLLTDSSVDGIKTSHTSSAGYCLVASAKRNDTRLISVVLGAEKEKERFQASQTLLNWGFAFFENGHPKLF